MSKILKQPETRKKLLPKRVRWLVVATAISSTAALFPLLSVFNPGLVTAVGAIQSRFPQIGKWLVWVGTIGSNRVTFHYAWIAYREPSARQQFALMTSILWTVSASLLLWCDIELIVDAVRGVGAAGFSHRAD